MPTMQARCDIKKINESNKPYLYAKKGISYDISIDSQKASEKIQHPFRIKILAN